jgi:hypothetical protein
MLCDFTCALSGVEGGCCVTNVRAATDVSSRERSISENELVSAPSHWVHSAYDSSDRSGTLSTEVAYEAALVDRPHAAVLPELGSIEVMFGEVSVAKTRGVKAKGATPFGQPEPRVQMGWPVSRYRPNASKDGIACKLMEICSASSLNERR